jgi:hypothetical protein
LATFLTLKLITGVAICFSKLDIQGPAAALHVAQRRGQKGRTKKKSSSSSEGNVDATRCC